jgi:hypothetical protein
MIILSNPSHFNLNFGKCVADVNSAPNPRKPREEFLSAQKTA